MICTALRVNILPECRGLKSDLVPDNRTLHVYDHRLLPIVGSFCALSHVINIEKQSGCKAVRLQKGSHSQAAKGINTIHADSIAISQFLKVFKGICKLSGYQLSLYMDPSIMPVAQKYCSEMWGPK